MLSKYKEYWDWECAPVYFNSTTKTVIGPEDCLDRSFQEVFNRIGNWISEGSGWKTESIDREYVNISIYSPLLGISYIKLPNKGRNSKTGMTKIKNIDNKCICWCHIRHLNPLKIHPERITKADNRIINDLDYADIKFKKLKQMMFMKIFIKKNCLILVTIQKIQSFLILSIKRWLVKWKMKSKEK